MSTFESVATKTPADQSAFLVEEHFINHLFNPTVVECLILKRYILGNESLVKWKDKENLSEVTISTMLVG